jgi:hypothetical protein
MALAKFSKFKKERSVIKEARSKEKKIKSFQKLFNEKLGELGLSSTADLSEDQINKVLASLATVNEDRMREIEKDGIIAGTPKPAGTEGEVAKKHTFDSPQVVDAESESDAEGMKAEESVKESKKSVKENGTEGEDDEEKAAHYKDAAKDDYSQIAKLKKDAHDDKESEDHEEEEEANEGTVEDIRTNLIDKPIAKIKDLYKKYIGNDPAKNIAGNAKAMVTMIATMAAENKELASKLLSESSIVEAADIKSDADFDKYADDLLKKAHPDDFDEATAKKVKDGLKKKYKDDYGAMVGALTSGFGG